MSDRIEIIKKLNQEKWDNNLIVGVMIFLGVFGIFGVYSTLDSFRPDYGQSSGIVSRRPPRNKRRELMISDSTGNGIKKNALASAN